ncbi:MAG TPA: AAA family ATPase [Gaiellaceae bacterium]|nr:AAA family ATPase [Gaiellaceae bacterium]
MTVCPACGAENPAGFRFCGSCGAELAEAATSAREVRKTVTILFCDVTGSTALGERLDSESLRRVMERYFSLARNVLERHGGTVEKFIGDAVMAVFGIPTVHEDDALRAARAAHELREELGGLNADLQREFGTELQVRMGVNTGEVVTSEGGTLATGDAVNVAARLEQAAEPGEILIGARTHDLAEGALELESVEPIEAKGKSDPVSAYRLLSVRADTPGFARRFDAAFVGREDELAQLRQSYARAVGDQSCHLFTLLGPAGIGKSRLVHEFLAEHEDAIVLRGRCLAYGEGITYFPLVEILEALAADAQLTGLLDRDVEGLRMLNTVSAAIGLVDQAALSREDTFLAVRRLFESLARERPLILVLDDLHWAEATFLDLVEHLADWSRGAPILLLCAARPDLLDVRPAWGGGKLNATITLLEPLSEDQAETLIDNLLGGADLSELLRNRIAAAAEGNPLFVEQMLALIAQNGHADEIAIPPTIQALLAARLEQLPSSERVAAERGSVIGKEFWRTALVELGGESSALPPLVRKELIRPYRSPIFPSDDSFRFRHQLIRDAAYDGMPKELRAKLHEQFGLWLEQHRSEYDEIVGYHLERAYLLREELGPLDEESRALGTRAGKLLGQAGLRASGRGDVPAAVKLLTRAAALLDETDEFRLVLLITLGYALQEAGDLKLASTTVSSAIEAARAAGVPAIEARGRVALALIGAMMGQAFTDVATVREEIRTLEALSDESGLAEAWFVAGTFEGWSGQSEAAAMAYERASTHATKAGNRRLAALPVGGRVVMGGWGYLPADKGLQLCDELLGEHHGTWLEGYLRAARSMHLSLLGRADEARSELDRANDVYRQFGNELFSAATAMSAADQFLRVGRPDLAEGVARDGIARLERFGEQGFLSTTTGFLAEALLAQGRYQEADEQAGIVVDKATADDFEAQMRWRMVRARVLAQQGEYGEAERLAREALEIGAGTDWHMFHASALLALADVLELAGRGSETPPLVEAALALYERKGARVEAEASRRRLAEARDRY